jgi:hypothetical protein
MKLNIKESIASHDVPSVGDHLHSAKIEMNTETPSSSKRELKIYSESEIFSHAIRKKTKAELSPDKSDKLKYPQGPYDQAIKILKSIKRYKVPFEKMMLIATISTEITECVNNFWKNFENIITSSMLNIDADELMTIFIYIIIKSQMPELLVHTKIIKEFTTSTTRSSMIGYYFTTLEASLIYILSVKDKSELLNKEKFRKSLIPSKSSFLINEDEEFTGQAINNSNNNTKCYKKF